MKQPLGWVDTLVRAGAEVYGRALKSAVVFGGVDAVRFLYLEVKGSRGGRRWRRPRGGIERGKGRSGPQRWKEWLEFGN